MRQYSQIIVAQDCQMDYLLSQLGLQQQIVVTRYDPQQTVNLYIGYAPKALDTQDLERLNRALQQLVAEGWLQHKAYDYIHPQE